MEKQRKKILTLIASLASLISGLLWFLAAKTQVAMLEKSGITLNEAAEKLNYLTQYYNFWAACAAMIVGIALALALLFD